jgi:hypothetical protein
MIACLYVCILDFCTIACNYVFKCVICMYIESLHNDL